MKHIILFTIIIIVFIVLGLIIINQLEMSSYKTKPSLIAEHFADTTPASSTQPAAESTFTPTEEEVPITGGSITLYNIPDSSSSSINFFERADTNVPVMCDNTSDCSTGLNCINLDGQKECLKDTNIQAYELNSDKNSYIELPINSSDSSLNHNIDNFRFTFNFILKNATTKKYLISSESKRWCMYNQNSDLFIAVIDSDGVEAESLKINSDPIFSYQLYGCTVNTFKDKVTAKLSTQTDMKELYFKDIACTKDSDCSNGNCLGDLGAKTCVLNNEKYYFGRFQLPDNTFQYLDGYMGSFVIPATTIQCDFYGATYKNKRKCEEDCARTQCSNDRCTSECAEVSPCEFRPMGRHSIDCIQHCIKNVDCNAAFCKTQCEDNCGGSGCPWQKKQDVEGYDSQYYDKDGKPSAVIITLANTSTDGTKVTMKWRPAYPGKFPVQGYLSYLYKTFKKAEAVKINKINLSICNDYCEYVLSDLEPNETYTFGIKAYNEIGLSQMSNLVTFKAEVTSLTFDLNIDYEVDENDVGSFNYCEDV